MLCTFYLGVGGTGLHGYHLPCYIFILSKNLDHLKFSYMLPDVDLIYQVLQKTSCMNCA